MVDGLLNLGKFSQKIYYLITKLIIIVVNKWWENVNRLNAKRARMSIVLLLCVSECALSQKADSIIGWTILLFAVIRWSNQWEWFEHTLNTLMLTQCLIIKLVFVSISMFFFLLSLSSFFICTDVIFIMRYSTATRPIVRWKSERESAVCAREHLKIDREKHRRNNNYQL